MATTEQLIERMGGGGTVGLAVAAVVLAPTLLPPVRRGLRGLAKAAIIQYLRVTEPRVGEVTQRADGLAAVLRLPRRGRRGTTEAPAAEGATTAAAPRARRRGRAATGTAQPAPPASASAAAARAPRRPRAQAGSSTAPPATQSAPAATSARTPRARPAQATPTTETPPAGRPRHGAAAPVAPPETERPSQGSRANGRAGEGKLNLNTATRAELTRLPRVGAQTADRILQFRQQQGPITGIRQLRSADVISAAAWKNIRDLVRF